MKKISKTAEDFVSQMRTYFQDNLNKRPYANEEPLRSELFTSGQMEKYGRTLAETHRLSTERGKDRVLRRLAENEKTLFEVQSLLTDEDSLEAQITPAGEWLVDNFYLIEEQIRTAKRHLPKGYSENLPKLANKRAAGLTRVYDIALQIISHSDGRIDIDSLSSFVKSYQTVKHLKLGELWAIPIMLRLALIENLRRVSAKIAIDRIDFKLADYWAKRLIETAENEPRDLIITIADLTRSKPPLVSSFIAELTRQLSGKGPGLALALSWIEQRLSESGLTSIELISAENQKQAADQVSVKNSIDSLRLLSAMDWRDFVEEHSVVENVLRKDPSGVYPRMDFTTRDQFRHVVEHVAQKSKLSEEEIAQIVLRLAEERAQSNSIRDRQAHVGFYLIGKGLMETRKAAKIPQTFFNNMRFMMRRRALFLYLSAVFVLTTLLTAGVFYFIRNEELGKIVLSAILVLAFVSLSQLVITLVNFLTTLIVKPRLLARMDFSEGIPTEFKTLVIIPSMLTNSDDIDELVEALEVRYLANQDPNLQFGLLTDFTDANSEVLPRDQKMLDQVRRGIDELNVKYGYNESEMFFLFHRPRRWNKDEKIWMGYERKRGKLAELNAILRGNGYDRFSFIIGKTDTLLDIKYVITLDADTQLPRGAAWKLIASMAHPLNRAFYNEKKQRVTQGYGILQPRVAVSLPDITASNFAKLHGNEPGIDPYTRASSDVYQDLFFEGSFIGKGIYDVDIFEKALGGKFPENRILSHDLIEGCYTRSGLISDVQLFEKYPSTYRADVKRRTRWIRGDWQIAAYFTPFIPNQNHKWKTNSLSALSRWKIFDNIRRSLVPIALTIFMLTAWIVLKHPFFWTLVISSIIVFPIVISSVWQLFKRQKDIVFTQHIILFSLNASGVFVQIVFTLICLPYEAFYTFLAIVRTTWRMVVSHKKLLEWNPSAIEERTNPSGLTASFISMWFEPVLALGTMWYMFVNFPNRVAIAIPILILWLTSPFVTWWMSRPLSRKSSSLSLSQIAYLRVLARKTWGFFERYVTEEDNWLPPDNFQERPTPVVAHRTSPTNVGLYLLSNLTAVDFGYMSVSRMLARTQHTFDTLNILPKHNNHLYNWYDTVSLDPLMPKYISTVDNGNFVGHLMTLKQGFLEILDQKTFDQNIFIGIRDTFIVLSENLNDEDRNSLSSFGSKVNQACESSFSSINDALISLKDLSAQFASDCNKIQFQAFSQAEWWKGILTDQIEGMFENMDVLKPWLLLSSCPDKFKNLIQITNPSLNEISKLSVYLPREIKIKRDEATSIEENEWLDLLLKALEEAGSLADTRISIIDDLIHECDDLSNIEWDFLYDRSKHLFTIGYKPDEYQLDPSYYDLLASESRLATFVGIAQGKLPEESWFALGRLVSNPGRKPVLLSWSGSMFEYLMPLLVMPNYENTLLDRTYKTSVARQIEYGNQRGVPWGNSESGYNLTDINSNYQYHAFGTPGLGLKRGLGEELVVAPYATVLALMVEPEKAFKNLEVMTTEGFEGDYGFYEAIDYTPARLPRGQNNAIIYSYMAHHQGMSLLSLSYLLLNQPMQRRFEAEPRFKASLLLLQERIPKATSYYAHTAPTTDKNFAKDGSEIRVLRTPNTPVPEVQLLSNGKYHVMVTNSGGGYSRWKDLAVTRWREDTTCDNWGNFCYIRDLDNDMFWTATFQPGLKKVKNYEVAFSQSRADFRGSVNRIEAHTEIVVSPEDDIEMRRMNLSNHSDQVRSLEITSYAEVVLASSASDAMAPAYSNLFVQTEIQNEHNAILCSRRPRSVNEQPPWMFHMMCASGVQIEQVSYETSRFKFVGRGNTGANPLAMQKPGPLSGSEGSVLDPVVAIRYKITLKPRQTVSIDFLMGISDSRNTCQALIEKYQDHHHKDRVFELAWTHNQVVLRHINASESDTQLYSRLAGSIIFANPFLRANPAILIKNQRGQSGLWGYSISGDLPIVLLKVENQENVHLVKQLIQAHTYWQLKGLKVDLVIWNEDHGGYRQLLQNQIQALISADVADKPGGIFVRASDQISNEDRILFQTVARVILSDAEGTLEDHLNRKSAPKLNIPAFVPTVQADILPPEITVPGGLKFFNGLGGFSPDGMEYIISVNSKLRTPAPWSNVIANPNFGTVVSESGQSYTWAENAHEYRLTPWNNDPVCDLGGEVFYIRDEESGKFWSTTLLPRPGNNSYTVRHGMGYSVFEYLEDGIKSEMWVYVDIDSAVKFTVLKIRNISGRPRKLSVTGYTEWVMGDMRPKNAMHIFSELDAITGALIAKNPYNTEFPGRVTFFDVDERKRSFTTDRAEFIGRNQSLQNPDAMSKVKLSGKLGAGFDPCAAIQIPFELDEAEEKEIVFRLGTGDDMHEALNLLKQFKGLEKANHSLSHVRNFWKNTLEAMQVETPDDATNIIANSWITYQTLSSRLWGRSGYYQSGGAFGFRDQLQDVLSLLHAQPELAREQILLAASRQFKEGDVQHWWHPPTGRGVRTRCSDDFLWLPYVTIRYIRQTGDKQILDEMISYLEGRHLNQEEESYYDLPLQSMQKSTLYDHCVRALNNGFRYGEHGLPLMGSGDWNDGMDQVGIHGRGESVWLGFFTYDILMNFIELAEGHQDPDFAVQCKAEADRLKVNIEKNAWDGEWYRRAYFDDGTPLGSHTNDECQIDSLSQSWSVISGVAEKGRAQTAMNSAYRRLVNKKDNIICLLDPAFDKSVTNPGYIKGYVAGVRENGGQYSHAAIWMIIAFTKLGDSERAWELFKMINPINHGRTPEEIAIYKVEPYVMAGDVYAVSPHQGHGGWTWYTGSAGWMNQLITDHFFGLRKEADKLHFVPCVPAEWGSFKIHYRYRSSTYHISFTQDPGVGDMLVKENDSILADKKITLVDDGQSHLVDIVLFRG
ncbi:MAG: cyclic beta 1-2 glucan synthetase [Bacteroidetes bacterium]|nr:cyclic beta 1-2 glucan synthetase [Bacteroidota bacterium]